MFVCLLPKISQVMTKWRRRASHLGRFTLWNNGRRATQLGRFTLWYNGPRATQVGRFTLWHYGRRATQLSRFTWLHNRRRAPQLGKFTSWHNGRRPKQPSLMHAPRVARISKEKYEGLRCLDKVFQRPYRYFTIALKVILPLSDRYKIFTNDWL